MQEKIVKIIEGAFTPGSLLMDIEQIGAVVKKGTTDEFLDSLLENCIKEDYATFKEGYWTDHWTYNIDLLEQFIQVYPDKVTEIMFDDADYTYYDNDEMVVPRNKRYVLTDSGVRQYGAVQKISGKPELIANRTFRPNQVRTKKAWVIFILVLLPLKFWYFLLIRWLHLTQTEQGLRWKAESQAGVMHLMGFQELLVLQLMKVQKYSAWHL